MNNQCCGTCKLFSRREEGYEHGYCQWYFNWQIIDMPEWAVSAVEQAEENKENFTSDYMGTKCPCYNPR